MISTLSLQKNPTFSLSVEKLFVLLRSKSFIGAQPSWFRALQSHCRGHRFEPDCPYKRSTKWTFFICLKQIKNRVRLSLQKVHQVDLFLFVLNKSKIESDCPYRDPRMTDWPYRDPRIFVDLFFRLKQIKNRDRLAIQKSMNDRLSIQRSTNFVDLFFVLNKSKIDPDWPYRDPRIFVDLFYL